MSNVRDSTDSFEIKESAFHFKAEGAEDTYKKVPDKGHESLMSMISKKHLIRKSLEQYTKELRKTPPTSRQCSPKLQSILTRHETPKTNSTNPFSWAKHVSSSKKKTKNGSTDSAFKDQKFSPDSQDLRLKDSYGSRKYGR